MDLNKVSKQVPLGVCVCVCKYFETVECVLDKGCKQKKKWSIEF